MRGVQLLTHDNDNDNDIVIVIVIVKARVYAWVCNYLPMTMTTSRALMEGINMEKSSQGCYKAMQLSQ